MADLKALVTELKVVQKRANIDLEAVGYQTRPSMSIAKAEAQEKLRALESQYLKVVRGKSIGIFLTGDAPRQVAFAKIASEEAGTFNVTADALYQRLARRIEPSLGTSREFSVTQLGLLIRTLRDIEDEMGIMKMNPPILRRDAVVRDHDEMVAYIRRLLREAVGDDLMRLYTDREINKAAVAAEFTGAILPVVVLGTITDEVTTLASLFTNAISVSVGTSEDGEITKEYVLDKLNFAKKKVSKK